MAWVSCKPRTGFLLLVSFLYLGQIEKKKLVSPASPRTIYLYYRHIHSHPHSFTRAPVGWLAQVRGNSQSPKGKWKVEEGIELTVSSVCVRYFIYIVSLILTVSIWNGTNESQFMGKETDPECVNVLRLTPAPKWHNQFSHICLTPEHVLFLPCKSEVEQFCSGHVRKPCLSETSEESLWWPAKWLSSPAPEGSSVRSFFRKKMAVLA